MAEKYPGLVITVDLGGTLHPASRRILAHLLDHTEGVVAYFIDPESRRLTAYLDESHVDDSAIVKALVTSGMYPESSRTVGAHDEEGGHAC